MGTWRWISENISGNIKPFINKDEKNYGTLLETGQLAPRYIKELIDNYNVYCICLGHSDKDLEIHAEQWTESNELLKIECPKYGIEYIDTHINRDETLNKIMEKIERII